MKLYAYIIAAILLAGLVGYGVHVWRKAERVDVAEAAQRQAVVDLKNYADRSLKAIQDFNARAEKDRKGDEALDARLTALEGVAADLRRAAASIRPTVEKTDAKGVARSVINPDYWLCESATLSGDTADAAACRAAAGDGSVSH